MVTLYKWLCMCRGEVWNLKKGIGNKKNHQKEKDITGSVKRANHNNT